MRFFKPAAREEKEEEEEELVIHSLVVERLLRCSKKPLLYPAESTMFPNSTSKQPSFGFNDLSSTPMFQTTPDVQSPSMSQGENVSTDLSIWLKEKWNPGEIPEEAPPDSVVR
ncbi:hypothetical protein AHAS_Ahas15G0327300 [Arachis hypogaea]